MDREYITVPLFDKNAKGENISLANSVFHVEGKNIVKDKCTIKFIMSREAMLGFAINIFRIKNSTDVDFSFHWHVDPLNSPSSNQSLGFFLTSDSPSVVLMYNTGIANYNEREFKLSEKKSVVDFNFYYDVPLIVDDKSYDEYEIGFSNIMRIIVFDENGENVTKNCGNVILYLNRNSLNEMAKFLLRYANEASVVGKINVPTENENECRYNTGIYTETNSCNITFELNNLGSVFDYEEDFGKNI